MKGKSFTNAASLLSELDDVRRLFSSTQPPKGRLRLDIPIALARAVIIPALRDFQNRYPDIEIILGTSDRKIDLIAERVDCVIRLGELDDSSFVAKRLGTAGMVTCAAPSYLAKYGTPQTIEELMTSHRAVNFFSNHSLQIMEWKFTVDGNITSIKIPPAYWWTIQRRFCHAGWRDSAFCMDCGPLWHPLLRAAS